MALVLLAGLAGCDVSRFPDGELQVSVDPGARGRDAYVLQPTGPPVDENLIELLMLADACRRAGAARVTAIVPYLGYARQDKRTIPGGALGLRSGRSDPSCGGPSPWQSDSQRFQGRTFALMRKG